MTPSLMTKIEVSELRGCGCIAGLGEADWNGGDA